MPEKFVKVETKAKNFKAVYRAAMSQNHLVDDKKIEYGQFGFGGIRNEAVYRRSHMKSQMMSAIDRDHVDDASNDAEVSNNAKVDDAEA